MHFLLHYPHAIRNSGPLVKYWSMRYESVHKYLKQSANSISSRVNVTYSIGLRYQLKISKDNYTQVPPEAEIQVAKKFESVSLHNLNHTNCINEYCVKSGSLIEIKTIPWVKYNSKKFC